MSEEGFQRLTGTSIPQANRIIPRSSCENLSVRTESDTFDTMRLPIDGYHLLTGGNIPQADNTVPPGARDGFVIGTKSNGQDMTVMPLKDVQRFPCVNIP